jgi:hypothetical protein
MQTQPNLVIWPFGVPLQQNQWQYAGQKGDGEMILKKVIDLFGAPNLQFMGMNIDYLRPWTGVLLTPATALYSDDAVFYYRVSSTDGGVTDFWAIKAIYTRPEDGKQYIVYEWTGLLADRLVTPNPWFDKKGDKLSYLVASEPADGYPGTLQLRWTA